MLSTKCKAQTDSQEYQATEHKATTDYDKFCEPARSTGRIETADNQSWLYIRSTSKQATDRFSKDSWHR